MAILNFKTYDHIKVSQKDDFLYLRLLNLFNQVKLIQGANDLNYTLRNHHNLRDYCIKKQIERIQEIETKYFNDDGTLKDDVIEASLLKDGSLQNI